MFVTALVDLVKIYLLTKLNTGDRALDIAVATLVVSTLSVVTANSNFGVKIWLYYKLYIARESCINNVSMITNQRLIDYFTKDVYPKEVALMSCTCKHAKGELLESYFRIVGAKLAECQRVILNIYTPESAILCYYYGETKSERTYYLFGQQEKAYLFSEIERFVEMYEPKIKANIFDQGGVGIGELYPDRTLDDVVSKHIPAIRELLSVVKTPQPSNIIHNVGLLLHGLPGTGKTSLMKGIANYLNRKIMVVDLREVTTVSGFKALFDVTKYKEYVYCIDEFDCVADVIAERSGGERGSGERAGASLDSKKSALRKEYLEVLSLMKNQEKADDKESPLQKELMNIKQKMKDLDEALTLDTMLTVLDGLVEMRGRVIVACTNYPDRIDKALLRPGRFDMIVELGVLDPDEMKTLILRHTPDDHAEKVKEMTFKGGKTPVAILNTLALFGRKRFAEALKELA